MPIELSIDELAGAQDRDLGVSGWVTITQEQVDRFAEVTGDKQWIHVDAVRAAAGPYGGTIAHGYLTLALLPSLMRQLFVVSDAGRGANYGLERVRFTNPVRVGAEIR